MKYDFFIDEKCTVWERSHHSIEADSEEEAIEKMKTMFEEEQEEVDSVEILYDTLTTMSLEENDNQATRELWRDSTNGNAKMLLNNEELDLQQ